MKINEKYLRDRLTTNLNELKDSINIEDKTNAITEALNHFDSNKDWVNNINRTDIKSFIVNTKSQEQLIENVINKVCVKTMTKKKKMVESKEKEPLKENTSNFSSHKYLPLLVFYTEEEAQDIMDYDSNRPTINQFETEDEYYDAVYKFEDNYKFGVVILGEEDIDLLKSKLDEFNYETKAIAYELDINEDGYQEYGNNMDLEDIQLVIKAGYFVAGQIYCENENYFDNLDPEVKETQLKRFNDFLNDLKKEFGLTEVKVSARFSSGETWYDIVENKQNKKSTKKLNESLDKKALTESANQYHYAKVLKKLAGKTINEHDLDKYAQELGISGYRLWDILSDLTNDMYISNGEKYEVEYWRIPEKAYDELPSELKENLSEDINDDLTFLAKDEQEAIDGYDKVINKSKDKNLNKQLKTIRDEEDAHLTFLNKAKTNKDLKYSDIHEGLNESRYPQLDINFKDWYTKEYPTDELGKDLNDEITLTDIYTFLKLYGGDGNDEYGDLYDYLGAADSIVRERVFDKISTLLGVDYDVIYKMWLSDGEFKNYFESNKSKNERPHLQEGYYDYMDKDYADILDQDVNVYDVEKFIADKTNNKFIPFHMNKAAVVVCANGKGVIADYEAIGDTFNSVDDKVEIELNEIKGDKANKVYIMPTHAIKVTPKEIIEKAPKETMKYRDFFRKYKYNDRCSSNFKQLANYVQNNDDLSKYNKHIDDNEVNENLKEEKGRMYKDCDNDIQKYDDWGVEYISTYKNSVIVKDEDRDRYTIWSTGSNRPLSKIGENNEYIPIYFNSEEEVKQYVDKNESCHSKKKGKKLKEGYLGQTLSDFFFDCIEPENIEKVVLWGDEDIVYEGSYDDIPEDMLDTEFMEFDCGSDKVVVNVDSNEEYQVTDYYTTLSDFLEDCNCDEVEVYDLGTDETLFDGDKYDIDDEVLDKIFISFDAPNYISINLSGYEPNDEDEEFEESLNEKLNYYVLEYKDGLVKKNNKLVLFDTDADAINYAKRKGLKEPIARFADEDDITNGVKFNESKKSKRQVRILEANEDKKTFQLSTGNTPILDVGLYYTILNELNPGRGANPERFKEFEESVKEHAEDILSELVEKTDGFELVSVDNYYHPRYYNYSTDELDFTVKYNKDDLKDLIERYSNDENFVEFLKNYKSYDGFISFYADNKDEFLTQEPIKSVSQIIRYNVSKEDKDQANEELYYRVMDDGFYPEDEEMEENLKEGADGNTILSKIIEYKKQGLKKEEIVDRVSKELDVEKDSVAQFFNDLQEDTIKTSKGKWVNKGDTGETHGEFATKKEADAQRKAMFAGRKKNANWGK